MVLYAGLLSTTIQTKQFQNGNPYDVIELKGIGFKWNN